MDKLLINGRKILQGSVKISGAKNSALALLAAAVMAGDQVVLDNIPVIDDVLIQVELLEDLGVNISWVGENKIVIKNDGLLGTKVSYDLARKLRASNLFLGALLAKTGHAEVPLPGGCNIGNRPMDLHIKGLQQMGVKIQLEQGYLVANGENMTGAKIYLDFPSVGATENLMMAATRATGTTIIENAAKEPEIVDLANLLNAMGAWVRGAGTDVIRIKGGTGLNSVCYSCIPDRIEAGTFMIAAAITRGKVKVEQIIPTHLLALTSKLKEIGITIEEGENWLEVDARQDSFVPADIKTLPYPGFATDLQSPMMSFLATVPGTSTIIENVFEGRYKIVDELKRMGGQVKVEGRTAIIEGKTKIYCAQVRGHDLRGGAGLILAALAAEGESEVQGVECVYRGYEGIVSKLAGLGAEIKREDC